MSGPADSYALSAFGLSISSEVRLFGSRPTIDEPPRERPVRVDLAEAAAIEAQLGSGEVTLERHWGDGSLGMRVTRLADGAVGIEAPGHGLFTIAAAGSRVRAASLQGPPSRWHRPLLGQVLPVAALLSGLEPLHASATTLGDGSVAISAPSNTGKTSLAVHLVDRGERLVTDDVLSLELVGDQIIAHPGSPVANVAAAQLAQLSETGRARLGSPREETDKVQIELAERGRTPLPLRAVVFLRRSTHFDRVSVEQLDPPQPTELLASTFLPHITTPSRLRRQLDICATIARSVPVVHFSAPAGVPAPALAEALHTWAEARGL